MSVDAQRCAKGDMEHGGVADWNGIYERFVFGEREKKWKYC